MNIGPIPAWEIPREFWAGEFFGGNPGKTPFFLESNPARIWNLNVRPFTLVAAVVMPGKIGWICFLASMQNQGSAFQRECDQVDFWGTILKWFASQGCSAVQFLSETLSPGSHETTGIRIGLPKLFDFVCNFQDLEWSPSSFIAETKPMKKKWGIRKGDIAFHEAELAISTMESSEDCPELAKIRSNTAAWESLLQVHGRTKDCWILEIEDQPSGILLGYPAESEKDGLVSYLGLIPEVRGLGWGKRFLGEFLEESRRKWKLIQPNPEKPPRITTMVDVRNRPARHLYESLGFRKKSEGQFHLAFLQPLSSK